jgi:hypothetical protein
MKRIKSLKLVVIFIPVLAVGSIIGIITYDGASSLTQRGLVESNITRLAIYYEAYKNDYDKYPTNLDDLRIGLDPERRETVNDILHDKYHDIYSFNLTTNGFNVSVALNAPWYFQKRKNIERSYTNNEVFK